MMGVMGVGIIFQLLVLLFSVVIHEVSHGVVAERLGDPTARLAGRLTLNPLKHLDPFGSVILPIMMVVLFPGGPVFGWAKPVPYNPYNLRRPEQDGAKIAVAGPASNFGLAIIFALIYRLLVAVPSAGSLGMVAELVSVIVAVNILLGVFNLVPIPPLDGSKVLFALLPPGAFAVRRFLEQYGFYLVLFFIFFGFSYLFPLIGSLFRLLTGAPLY